MGRRRKRQSNVISWRRVREPIAITTRDGRLFVLDDDGLLKEQVAGELYYMAVERDRVWKACHRFIKGG